MCVCTNIAAGAQCLTQICAKARIPILQDGLSPRLPRSAPANAKLTRAVRADVRGARCLREEEEEGKEKALGSHCFYQVPRYTSEYKNDRRCSQNATCI